MTLTTAMVMAAGLGTRMRPLTNDRCKALVEVGGKTLIDHMLDRLAAAGVTRAIVNVHAFADRLEAHLKARTGLPKIIISDERAELLETGGGLVKALPLLGAEPILICNIDAIWLEFDSVLGALIAAWNPKAMDELFLLAPKQHCLGTQAKAIFIWTQTAASREPATAAAAAARGYTRACSCLNQNWPSPLKQRASLAIKYGTSHLQITGLVGSRLRGTGCM